MIAQYHPFAETIEELLSDALDRAFDRDFHGCGWQKADADTLDSLIAGRLSARHVVAWTLDYAKHCGKPIDELEPREVADAFAVFLEKYVRDETERRDALAEEEDEEEAA